jgi:tetratricopeptide (TPR) repeat protein
VLSLSTILSAQNNQQTQAALARQYLQQQEYEKALPILKSIYEQAPFDKAVYADYLETLIQVKRYEQADSLVQYMMQIRRGDPAMLVDLGRVDEAAGKRKAAREHYQKALDILDGNEFHTKDLAVAFEKAQQDEYAIRAYEKARLLVQNPYAYATELSLLYNKAGRSSDAISALLDMVMTQQNILETVKTGLSTIADDKNGFSLIQKELEKRIQDQPGNPFWQELISWIFVQKGDYEGAFKQLIALDKKLDEAGARVLPFAQNAAREGKYDIAGKSFDYIIDQGKEQTYYSTAFAGKMNMLLEQFEQAPSAPTQQLDELLGSYSAFFREFPEYERTDMWRDYAMLLARYKHNTDTAIALLSQVVGSSHAEPSFIGRCKLDIGDYLLLEGKVWDATLMYSQVDKAFRQDLLGEQARFKNAKLAYYRGDFKLAQEQLSVLKASTTELIANDALYLSVLITENMPPDSNLTPLLRFAAADLLLFQHKPRESDQLLDSISRAFPQSALQDDIAMLRAQVAMEEHRWGDAISLLELIIKKYGEDVLGDDAAFKLADIYQYRLREPGKAKAAYELLITQYPGSTYVQEARKQYEKLNSKNAPDS